MNAAQKTAGVRGFEVSMRFLLCSKIEWRTAPPLGGILDFSSESEIREKSVGENPHVAPVAQLDRAADYGSAG
jgi:hypothetical protein